MPSLHWLTKETDSKSAANTPYRLLLEEETHSYGDQENGKSVAEQIKEKVYNLYGGYS
jgi:hypothetical protein